MASAPDVAELSAKAIETITVGYCTAIFGPRVVAQIFLVTHVELHKTVSARPRGADGTLALSLFSLSLLFFLFMRR